MSIDSKQVQQWIERLTNAGAAAQFRVVGEMTRVAIRTRGAVRTRGAIHAPATAEVPDSLETALDALSRSADDDLRREVAYALGGLGGVSSVLPLCHLALHDQQARVRAEAVSALGKIGGQRAVEALRQAASHDADETVRAEAVDGLGVLLTTASAPHETRAIEELIRHIAQADISPYVRQRAAMVKPA